MVATNISAAPKVTISQHGRIGVDINVNHLAIAETDSSGNLLKTWTIKTNVYGKSTNQAKAILGDAAAELVKIALKAHKPIVLEKLDFKKKIHELDKDPSKASYSRMLSSFHYSSMLEFIKSRSFRYGVEIFEVNPAYTSVLGRVKFSSPHGITVHHGAALAIARRSHGFSEALKEGPVKIAGPRGKVISFHVPARNRAKHVWSHLKQVATRLKVALAGPLGRKPSLPSLDAIPIASK